MLLFTKPIKLTLMRSVLLYVQSRKFYLPAVVIFGPTWDRTYLYLKMQFHDFLLYNKP